MSEKVLVPGSVNVYDEWALKLGEFGDTENDQSLDIKINESSNSSCITKSTSLSHMIVFLIVGALPKTDSTSLSVMVTLLNNVLS